MCISVQVAVYNLEDNSKFLVCGNVINTFIQPLGEMIEYDLNIGMLRENPLENKVMDAEDLNWYNIGAEELNPQARQLYAMLKMERQEL